MDRRQVGRIALLAGASALLVVPAAWRSGVTGGNCGTLEEVVNTGNCVAGPGGNVIRHKSGKLLDLGRCTTYDGRAADEDATHRNRPSSDAPFNTTRDFDSGDIAVMYDDGTLITELSTGTEIDFIRAVKKFYLNPSHSDAYQIILFWPNFNHAEGSFHLGIKNGIRGIHRPIEDNSATYGTHNLESFVNLRNYINFPYNAAADPNDFTDMNTRIPGNNDTSMSLIAQESGHRWGAYVHFDSDPSSRVRDSSLLIGRGAAHWCYFANVPASREPRNSSSLEGNAWIQNSTSSFTQVNTLGTGGYSQLDHYLMGFRLPTEVASTFTIKAAQGTTQTCSTAPYTPETDGAPLTVSGTRTNVAITDITRIEGARIPDATMAPRKLRMAFILLAKQNTTVSNGDIVRLDKIRRSWESYFSLQTDSRGQAITTLGPVDLDGDGFRTDLDCNDNDPLINPLGTETCNHIDENCDGSVDEGFDADGDLWTTCNGDCNDAVASVNPNASENLTNGVDDNCDGAIDNPIPVDNDADGYSPPRDCNDAVYAVNPGAVELVDGVDNNCNGFIDCDDPTVVTETEKGARATDGLDNDCNDIIDG